MQTERRFNLIKTDIEHHEKRIFPRFPVCYLTFKSNDAAHAVEVKDISFTGMQLGCSDNRFQQGENLAGTIHWLGHEMKVRGSVVWVTRGRAGVEFTRRAELAHELKSFLTEDRFIAALKPLHRLDYGVEWPEKLKYWLRSDGPVEILIWKHPDGELSQFQVLLLENFVEWQDGMGVKTGRIMSKRNVDTPLLNEDELIFRLDETIDDEKLQRIRSLVSKIPAELLSVECKDFLLRKLS